MLTSIIRTGGVKCDLCDFNYGIEETAGARKTGSIISETDDLSGISIEFAQNGTQSKRMCLGELKFCGCKRLIDGKKEKKSKSDLSCQEGYSNSNNNSLQLR